MKIRLASLASLLLLLIAVFGLLGQPATIFAGGTINHRFVLDLPNGEQMSLQGASVHSAFIEASHTPFSSDECTYDPNQDHLKNRPYDCYTASSCGFASWHAPFLPADFNTRYSAWHNGATFEQDLQSRFPYLKALFRPGNPRGFEEGTWIGDIGTICPIGGCDDSTERQNYQFEIVSYTRPSQANIFKDGTFAGLANSGFYPEIAKGELDDLWLRGVNANNAVGWNEKGGTREILFTNVGGNTLQGEVAWRLRVESAPAQCSGFNTYKGAYSSTETLGSTASLLPTDTLTVKQANTDAQGRPQRQDICWAPDGLTQAEYATGKNVFTCATTCVVTDGNYNQPQAGTEIVTFDLANAQPGQAPPLLVRTQAQAGITITCDPTQANHLHGGLTGTVESYINTLPSESIKAKARENGLIFVQNAWDHKTDGKTFCSTNPYKGTEEGVVFVDGGAGDVLNTRCGVSPNGNCTRRITLAAPQEVACRRSVAVKTNTSGSTITVINAAEADYTVGDEIRVGCQVTPNSDSAQFRMTNINIGENEEDVKNIADAEWTTYPQAGRFNLDGVDYYASAPINTEGAGRFATECRVCAGANCTPWHEPEECMDLFSITERPPTLECLTTSLAPATINANESIALSLNCGRRDGATHYRVTRPGLAPTFHPLTGTGNFVYTIPATEYTPSGNNTFTCVPCSGQTDASCATVTPACQANLNVNYGTAVCNSKTGTYNNAPLASATSINRGEYINYEVSVTISAATSQDVIVEDVYDTNTLIWDGTEADAGVTHDPTTKKITINYGKSAGTFVKKYRLKTADVKAGASFSNTATLIHNGNTATSQVCGSTSGDIPFIGEVECKEGGKVAYLVKPLPDGSEDFELLTGNSQVPRGALIEYRVTISNNQYATKVNGIVEDTINIQNVAFVENSFLPASQFTSFTATTGKLIFTIPVAPGEDGSVNPSSSVSYRVRVLDLPQTATIPNSVKVTDNGKGGVPANNDLCFTSFSREPKGTAVCTEKTATTADGHPIISNPETPTFVDVGDTIHYSVVVSASEQTVGAVTVVDTLPTKLSFVSATLDSIAIEPAQSTNADGSVDLTFSLPAFGSSGTAEQPEQKVIKITAQVKADATPGTVTNKAVVTTASSTSSSECEHSAAVPPDGVAICNKKEMFTASGSSPGSVITKSTILHTGTEFFYKITLSASTLTAGKVEVTDTLPGGLLLIDKKDFDSYDQATGVLKKTFEPFTGEKVILARVKIRDNNAAGPIANTAIVKSFDRNNELIGTPTSCGTDLIVPRYACNTSCTSNTQCESVNSDYLCASNQGNRCRLKANPAAEDCQAPGYYCNSTCENNAQCEGVNPNYTCADTNDGKRCRLKANPADYSCQPVRATPTPTPTVGCNSTCINNADCSNPQHVCFEERCRLAENVTSTTCTLPSTPSQPRVPGQAAPPQELPQTGPEQWGVFLKAGAVVLGVGALLLLLL